MRRIEVAVLFLSAFCRPPLVAQTQVTLTSPTAPPSGTPGVTVINVTGSNFPSGTIDPTAVSVQIQSVTPGTLSATQSATAVTTLVGSSRRVTFTIPSSISVNAPTAYGVSISGQTTTGTTFVSSNRANLTVNPSATIPSVAPPSGFAGQTVSVTITGTFTSFVQGASQASFGAGVSVGGAAAGSFGPIAVKSSTSATALLAIAPSALVGPRTVTVRTGVEQASGSFNVVLGPPPVITDFTPKSAAPGALITVTGTNLAPVPNVSPAIALSQQGGGTVLANVISANLGSVAFIVPSGAVTGPVNLSVSGQSVTSAAPLAIVSGSVFAVTASPANVNLIQGQAVGIAVQLTSSIGFTGAAQLGVTGLPSGITAAFTPANLGVGQTAILTLTAAAGQVVGATPFSVTASATVNGVSVSQLAGAQVSVQAPTTSFIGRTVVSDSLETPLAGVTVTMTGKDGNGATTGCAGTTVSDAAGNFALRNLAANCVGLQLVSYDGTTTTSPTGKYAGVNLIYTLSAGQVTASPVLVHLPRIDNTETFNVQQNAATDQNYSFSSIPGLSVTVYAHTTFTMPDGTQPNPFPLTAVNVPVDRLPDYKPPVPTMLNVFIVAFQPANVTATVPVAVSYPNTLNSSPGTNMPLLTLDPTLGKMVPYGTGTVSADGKQVVPDADPARSGHRYGIVHFDWHGNMPPPPSQARPSPPDGCTYICDPVDFGAGLMTLKVTDLAINGPRGKIFIERVYRSATNAPGPFGIGTGHNYSYSLDTAFPQTAAVINLVLPDSNRIPFSKQGSVFTNATIPLFLGATMTVFPDNSVTLRLKGGTVYKFTAVSFELGSLLASITDPNGNTVSLTRNATTPIQIAGVSDPVGRTLNLSYDSSNRITSITDPSGRTVVYVYNAQGTLAAVTDPLGGTTRYTYDTANRLLTITNARGLVVAQNVYNPANGRITQQTAADGGVYKFIYTFLNPTIEGFSPIQKTTITDPLGHQTIYRFNSDGYVVDVTDAAGQTRTLTRVPGSNLLVGRTGAGACSVCGSPQRGDEAFTYDANGNLLTRTDALGNTTTFAYEPTFNKIASIRDPLGNVRSFSYDGHGNLTLSLDANGNATAYSYNAFGQLISIVDPLGNKTIFTYDGFGNLSSVSDPIGSTTSYAYDGVSRLTLSVDPLGRQTRYSYDALDRLISQVNAQKSTTRFEYDAVGNLLSLTDTRSNKTAFSYDGLERLLTLTTPSGFSDTRTYDQAGNILTYTNRRGQVLSYTYDGLNRLVGELFPEGSVSRTYDVTGRLVQVADSTAGQFTFTYDRVGRLVVSTSPIGSVLYGYDNAGRQTSRQVAGLPTTIFRYDGNDNLVGASQGPASFTRSYDRRNLTSTMTRTNGVSTQYAYDSVGRLLSVAHRGATGAFASEVYGYDAAGNRTSTASSSSQPLTTPPTASATYGPNNEQTAFGSLVNAFDADGNVTSTSGSAGLNNFTWDSRGRLLAILSGGQRTEFTYDFAGNLIKQQEAGPASNAVQAYVLDSLTNIASIQRSDGNAYSILAGVSLDDHVGVLQPNGESEWGVSGALNSTLLTTDQGGAPKGRFSYEPFGQTFASNTTYPFQYTGRTPAANGLYYLRARFYNSQTGRFISEDPIGFAGGTNLYAYVGGNPLSFFDPYGLYRWDELLYDSSNFAAGFGDTISLGATLWVRTQLGENSIDFCSGAYTAGRWTGYAYEAALTALTLASATGMETKLAIHGPHHAFGGFGKLSHIQLNWWWRGGSGSGGAFRIPLPWR